MAVSVQGLTVRTLPVAYTPILTNGTNGTASGFWYRDGLFMWIDGLITWTGAGEAGALAISIPAGFTINTAFLTGGTANGSADPQNATVLGFGQWRDAGTQFEPLNALYASTTTFNLNENAQLIFGNQMANTDSLKFTIKIPIVGWS